MNMVKINVKIVPIICLLYIGVYSKDDDKPWVWPPTATVVHNGSQQMLEFTCGANLKKHEQLAWFRDNKDEKGQDKKGINTTSIEHSSKHNEYRTIKLIWPLGLMHNVEAIYCAKQDRSGTKQGETTYVKWIGFQADRITPMDVKFSWGPWVFPDTFSDDGQLYIEVTCWAYLNSNDNLSWYQRQNAGTGISPGNGVIKLAQVQQNTSYGYMKITLRKKLEHSDNGTEIYCTREGASKGEYFAPKPIKLTLTSHRKSLDLPSVKPATGVVFFDEGEELEFICGGSNSVAGTNLTWFKGGTQAPGNDADTPSMQSYHKSSNLNHLTLPVNAADHNRQLYCAQQLQWDESEGMVLVKNRELARSRPITLLHRAQCKQNENPRVSPEVFIDDGKPFIHFTCYAFLQKEEVLFWYSSQGRGSKPENMLRTIQLQDTEEQWTVLDLKKTLELSDNDSEIVCAKHRQPDGHFSDRDIISNSSTRIELKFNESRYFQPLEPALISAEQPILNGSVYFDVNTKLRFTCNGSKPVDGRNYTWLMEVPGSNPTVPQDQKYDGSTNTNVLEISPKITHDGIKLFCVQGYLTYIRLVNGSLQNLFYGELNGSRSEILNLVWQDPKSNTPSNPDWSTAGGLEVSNTTLAVGIPLVLVTLGSVALATWVLCRRRAPQASQAPPTAPAPQAPADYNSEALYVNLARMESPEVTYAVLDLPKKPPIAPRPKPPPASAPEACLYAEIVGVHK